MKKMLIFLLAAFFIASCGNAQPNNTSLDAAAFKEQIAAHPDAVILDVRTPEEFSEGHIEGAVNYNWNDKQFDDNISALDKSKPVYVYCLSGGRSDEAAKYMRKKGFSVYELDGGMMKWRAAQLPETAEQPQQKGMTRLDFEKLITNDKIVLVDFYAEWCIPCKKMKPYLEDISTDMKETVTVVRIDVDKNPELSRELKIDVLPTLQVYRQGQVSWSNIGYVEKSEVVKQLK